MAKRNKLSEIIGGFNTGVPDDISSSIPEANPDAVKSVVNPVHEVLRGGGGVLAKAMNAPGDRPEIVDQTNSDALGLKIDGDGIPLTPSQQTVEAIIYKGAADKRPYEQTQLDLGNAIQLDQEIQNDSQRISAIDKAIKQAEQLATQKTQQITKEVTPELTVEDFEQAGLDIEDAIMSGDPNWKRMTDQYKKMVDASKVNMAQPAIERLGLHEYYPDINSPLQVGVYSGSIVGSNPIFVAGGGYIPFSVIDARKRALENAAKQKAIKKQKIMDMMWAKGAIQYQSQIDQMSIDMLDQYAKATNNDFSKLTDFDSELSLQWSKDVQKLHTFANQTTAVNQIVENLQKQENDEKLSIPAEIYSDMYDWYAGTSNMKEFYDDPNRMTKLRNQFRSYDSMIFSGNLIIDKIQKGKVPLDLKNFELMEGMEAKDLTDAIYSIQHGNYDEKYWAMLKFVDEKRLDDIVNSTFRDKNFYIGNPTDSKSTEKAKLEFKKYLMNMLSKETEIQNRMINHNNGFLAFKRQQYGDQKKKEEIWTTIHNRAKEQQDKLARVAQGVVDPNARDEQMQYAYTQMGWSPIKGKDGKFLNGEVRGRVQVPQGVQGKEIAVPAGQVVYEINGKAYTLSTAQNVIKSKYTDKAGKVDYNKMSESDKYMLSLSANDVIPGASVVDATQQYQYIGENGRLKTVNINDGADKWAQATTTGTLIYAGNPTIEVPLRDKQGKQVYGYAVSYYDKDKEQILTTVVSSEAEANKLASADKRNRVIGKKPQTYKQNISLPRMRRTIDGSDDINVSVMNEMWTGPSKSHLASYYQGEETFDMGGGGSQTQEGEGDSGIINLDGE